MALYVANQPLRGSCFCGAVSYVLSGRPILSAYCHCTNCQRLTGARVTCCGAFCELAMLTYSMLGCPFVHSMHYKGSDFAWSHAEPHDAQLDFFVIPSRPHKTRARCKSCGATVASYNSDTTCWSVWGAHLRRNANGAIDDWDSVKPTAHIFYGTRMLDIDDDLGKWEGYENRSPRIG